ncbi:hypothetical protein FACS189431_0290 [Alphaproteobacteria bacterium]|nr:hypothetical protein FACS189431_0290 [Alphaproteobacteria bacterium]
MWFAFILNMQEISLKDYFKYVLKTWKLSVLFVVLGLVGGVAYSYLQTPMYKTESKIMVSDKTALSGSREASLGSFVELMKSQTVLGEAVSSIGVEGIDVAALHSRLTVKNEKNTDVITVEYISGDSTNGEYVVGETINSFKNSMYDLYGVKGEGINVISYPYSDGEAYNISLLKQITIGFGAGVVLALVVAFLRYDALLNESKRSVGGGRGVKRLTPEEKKLLKLEFEQKKAEIEAGISEAEARKVAAESEIASANAEIAKSEIDLAQKDVEVARAKKEAADLLAKEVAQNTKTEKDRVKAEIEQIKLDEEKAEVERQADIASHRAELETIKIKAEAEARAHNSKERIDQETAEVELEKKMLAAEAHYGAKVRRAEIKAKSNAQIRIARENAKARIRVAKSENQFTIKPKSLPIVNSIASIFTGTKPKPTIVNDSTRYESQRLS